MNYNFVIFASDFYCYETAYGDVIDLDNVQYLSNYIPNKNKFQNYLYRIHHSPILHKIVDIPNKKFWFRSYFENNFLHDYPICFMFFGRNLILEEYGYVEYLKKKYPNSKYVCFFQDLMVQHSINNIDHLKTVFDLIISFDHNDANQYNIEYFSLVNSKSKDDLSSNLNESDVFFLGAAKNRFDEIIAAYEKLRAKNLKCDFHIVGVKPKDQKYSDDIHYIKDMSYIENLKHIVKANSILEIMQQNGHGFTQRMVEAIVYDKKIITNNPEVKTSSFYNPSNIFVFDNSEELGTETLFFENFGRKADHEYKDEISPLKLLEFITEKLN